MSAVLRAAVPAMLAVLILSACEGEDPLGPVPISGTFRLVQVDGDPLPAFVSMTQGQAEIEQGRLRLEAHGRYLEGFIIRLPGGVAGDFRESGAFGGEHASLRFQPDEGGRGRFEGSASGDTIKILQNLFFDTNADLEELTFVRESS